MKLFSKNTCMAILCAMPILAFAQTAADSASQQAAEPVSAQQKTAINQLFKLIDVDGLSKGLAEAGKSQSKQIIVPVVNQILNENKTLSTEQKQALVPILNNAVPSIAEKATAVFGTEAFQNEVRQALYSGYGALYTTRQLKDIIAFYQTSTGKKFLQVQSKLEREVVSMVLQKYASQSVQIIRDNAEKIIAAAKTTPSKTSDAQNTK